MNESQRALWRTLERQHGIAPDSGPDVWIELIERAMQYFYLFDENIVSLCIHEIARTANGDIVVPLVTEQTIETESTQERHAVIYETVLNKLQLNNSAPNSVVLMSEPQRHLVPDAEGVLVVPRITEEYHAYQVQYGPHVQTSTSQICFTTRGDITLLWQATS